MLSETHTFSPTLINEFRFGFNYGNDSNLQYNYNRTLRFSGIGRGARQSSQPGRWSPLGSGRLPGIRNPRQRSGPPGHEVYQVLDNVTKVIGNHSLKVGVEINPGRWYSTNAGQPLGSYSYDGSYTGVTGAGGPTGNGVADFIALGTAPGGGYTNTDNMASGQHHHLHIHHFVQKYNAAYVQDDWKVTPRLTLNLGLRYEYFTPKREQAGQLANLVRRAAP